MNKINVLTKLNEMIRYAIALLLLSSPFIIGYHLWILLLPITCIEKILSLLLILGICSIEGFVSWVIGLTILDGLK